MSFVRTKLEGWRCLLPGRFAASLTHQHHNAKLLLLMKIYNVHVIYQTLETVFHRDIQTPRRELKIRRAAEYF